MTIDIQSNIPNLGVQIQISEYKSGEPRKIISEILQNQTKPTLIQLIFVGKRVITQENLNLLNGRRHRKFWGLKTINKIYIKYGWHKIKHLTQEELSHLYNNWNLNYFEEKGKYLIEKSGGLIHPNNLLYNKMKIIL